MRGMGATMLAAAGALLALMTACGSATTNVAATSATIVSQPVATAAAATTTDTVTTTTPPGAANACTLVSQDEATRAMGVAAGAPHTTPNGETCVYTNGTTALVVRIATAAEITGGDPQRALQAIEQTNGGHPTGGSATIVYDDPHSGKSAAFVKKNALVIIGIAGPAVPDSVLEGLAAAAESRY